MKKEELMLFPVIRKGGNALLAERIPAMRADHDDHDRDLVAIHRQTNDLTVPEGACQPWITLYEGLAEFSRDLSEHIRLENEVLFPQLEPGARVRT